MRQLQRQGGAAARRRRALAPDPRAHDQRPACRCSSPRRPASRSTTRRSTAPSSASRRRTTSRCTDFRAALEKRRRDATRASARTSASEILLARLREREVDNAIVVTDAEVETELAREAREATERFGIQPRARAGAGAAAGDARADRAAPPRAPLQALSELRRGANFAQVAATYSDAPDALQGGNLGWRAVGAAAAALPRGARASCSPAR